MFSRALRTFFSVALVLLFSSTSSADTIEFKDGKKIECVVVAKGPARYAIKTWKAGLCNIKNTSIEIKSVASFKEADSFDNQKLIDSWTKKIWDSCPDVRKQAELREKRAVGLEREERKRIRALEREEQEEERKASEIKGASKYVGNSLHVINENDFDWENTKLDLNPGFIFSGYIYKPGHIEAGQTRVISMSEFSKKDGTRFDIFKTKPVELAIYADTPNGLRVGVIKFK